MARGSSRAGRWSDYDPAGTWEREPLEAWRRDVALEIWVDVEHAPATIRLAGTITASTAVNLLSMVAELIGQGYRTIGLETSALCVPDEGGARALRELQRLVEAAGGCLVWTDPAGATGAPSAPERLPTAATFR